MANKKLSRPETFQIPVDYSTFYQQPQQPLRNPDELRLPPAIRQAGLVLTGDEPATPMLPPRAPFPPEVRRPYNQGLYIDPVPTSRQFGEQVPTVSTTSGGRTTTIELGGNSGANAPSTMAPSAFLNARPEQPAVAHIFTGQALGNQKLPGAGPGNLRRMTAGNEQVAPPSFAPGAGELATGIRQMIKAMPSPAVYNAGVAARAQSAQGGRPAMSRPTAPASTPEPPMQRYAYNQMPAALTAPQAAVSPIAPAQVLPSQANLAAKPQLSQAPAMGTQAPTESQRAMDAYAASRMAKMQPGRRMTDIDLAREEYINQGARPVLDVNQAGMPIVAKQRRGLGEILKTAGAGALQGLASGGISGAIGGALSGGIAQAVSPEAGRRLRFEALERPGLEQARQQQIAEAQQLQQNRLTEAQIGNLESQALERAADIEFRGEEADRRGKYVTLGAGETFYERDPRTGRMVPRATNPREFADRGGSADGEAAAQSKMMREAYEAVQGLEKIKADVVRFGNDITDQAKGSPEYKAAMQRLQSEAALIQQRYPGMIKIDPVTDQYGNTQYNATLTDPTRRAPLLSPGEQKAAQASKNKAAGGGKRPSSSIEPRPKSKLMSLLD